MQHAFDSFFDRGSIVEGPPDRPCVLLISHDASRTGAPFTLLWLADAIGKTGRFDVRIMTRDGGPLVEDFARVAPTCVAIEHCGRLRLGYGDLAQVVADRFVTLRPRGLAVCNTVAIPEFNEAFARAGADVLTLIHELPAFFDASTMERIVRSSRHVGVYSAWNRAHYTGRYAIPDDKLVFVPPVLPDLAASITSPEQRLAARREIGIPEDALMVLGVGYVHLIKGSDLFVQIATRCARTLSGKAGLAFRWIGADGDASTRTVLLHDIEALGLSDVVTFAGLQDDPWPWYRAADVFACTSRWEAMGLSILEAMSSGLPVVTFADAGASRFVTEAEDVIGSLDIDAFSRRVAAYLNDPALRARAGAAGHRRIREEFGECRLPQGLSAVLDDVAAAGREADLDQRADVGFDPRANPPPATSETPMPSPLLIDPTVFDPAAISAETRRLNEEIVRRLEAEPTGLTIPEIRARRIQGFGAFPPAAKSPRAETVMIPGPAGEIELRMIAPASPRGIYFHIHGGGWSIGAPDQNDPLLERIADGAGLACVSVKYRLGPEHPYPAGPDDCEAAALWVVREGTKRFGTTRLAIGGESAGGHLSVVMLLRLRDRHKLTPFAAAFLNYGCFDLGMTPSARNWGTEKLVLNTPGIVAFAKSFLPPGTNTSDPDVSPLYADLRGLPPALFTVGTRDPLIDDSLFMAPRWLVAGNVAEIAILPGACHGFLSLPSKVRDDALAGIVKFSARYVG